jgi:DNA-binding response OmpR family regulator
MSNGKRVLIIDDDQDFGNALAVVLEGAGYEVEQALNAAKGRLAIERDRPDLIILDVMLEKHTDGFELCYSLKHDQDRKRIPILMATGVTAATGFKFSPETDGEYLLADDYVAKPIPVADLLARVDRLLTKSQDGAPRGNS